MITVEILKNVTADGVEMSEGALIDVPDRVAQKLIARGYAMEISEDVPLKAKLKTKPKGKG
jgi:hypothetical protein